MTPTSPTAESVYMSYDALMALCVQKLEQCGLSTAHAKAMSRFIVAGQRDASSSHGIYRVISCVQAVQAGQVNVTAEPEIAPVNGVITRIDAKKGFSPLAFERGLPQLVETTRQYGIGAMVINHCFHFSALWPEVEWITEHGLVGLAMNPSHAWVAPAGGRQPVFGTNPIAFGWPRANQFPYVFDFATSAIARGDLELHRRAGTPLPEGVGIDAEGRPTTDPLEVARGAMLAFGGHKGSALSTMIELMGGALIGDMTSAESLAFDAGAGVTAYHGELVLAFDPVRFADGDTATQEQRAETLFSAIVDQGARLPSQRRYTARQESAEKGIRIPKALLDDVMAL